MKSLQNNKIASLVVAACLGLSLTTSCTASGSGSISPNATSPTASQNQSQSSLAIQAQTALANYHAVDGAFYDSARLSSSGSFNTKQLGGLVDDVVDTVSGNTGSGSTSGSGNASGSVNVGASTNTSGSSNGSGSASTGVSVGANTNTSTNTSGSGSNSSTGLNTGVNVGVDANASGSGSNGGTSTGLNTGINAGVNTDLSGSGSNGSTSTGLNTGINAGVNTNVSGSNTGSSSALGSDLNLNTDINADLNSTMESMQRLNSQLRTNLESTGSVRFTGDNNSVINESTLRTNVESAINSNTSNDLQGFNDNSLLQNGRLNLNSNVSGMSSVQSQQLLRNSTRGFNTSAGQIRSQTNADGSVTNFFGTSFAGNDTNRNVLVADRVMGNAKLGSDFMLSETGNGFTTDANRVSSINADGSTNLVTRSTTNFDNGDRIDILEERVVDASGRAAGNGTLTLTDANGRSQSFDLRTMANVDGSLVSNLEARDNSMNRLVLRENASGNATLSFINTTSGSEDSRTSLDFNAMLDAMSNFDFS